MLRRPSGIGGQAVIEGVMMRNGSKYAVAVRKADQSIEVKIDEYHSISERFPFLKAPLIRGIVNFIEALYLGMKTVLYSASFYEEEEAKRKEEWEEWISTGTGRNFTGDIKKNRPKGSGRIKRIFNKIAMFLVMLCSVVIAVALFMLLPMFLSEQVPGLEASVWKTLLEGVIRLVIFFLYLLMISGMGDIRRVFMYHGAEHKVINCVENGLELTVENARGQSRLHKRCGTSFLFLVVFLSILFFLLIRTEILWQKLLFRFLLIPVIAAVSYEFIRFAGKSEHPVVEFFSKPGLCLQKLTTKEPEDDMILVAIQSVEAVFDWREFLQNMGVKVSQQKESSQQKEDREENKEEDLRDTETEETKKTFSMTAKERLQQTIIHDAYESGEDFGGQESEDDPILKALDKFFGS